MGVSIYSGSQLHKIPNPRPNPPNPFALTEGGEGLGERSKCNCIEAQTAIYPT